jgi:hypothetical protein
VFEPVIVKKHDSFVSPHKLLAASRTVCAYITPGHWSISSDEKTNIFGQKMRRNLSYVKVRIPDARPSILHLIHPML